MTKKYCKKPIVKDKYACDSCKHREIVTGIMSGDRQGTIIACKKFDKGIKMVHSLEGLVDTYPLEECDK